MFALRGFHQGIVFLLRDKPLFQCAAERLLLAHVAFCLRQFLHAQGFAHLFQFGNQRVDATSRPG